MAVETGFELMGAKELDRALAALGPALAKQALDAALRKAAQPIATAANELAPMSEKLKPMSKRLKGSFIVRTTLSRSQRQKRAGRRALSEVFVGSTRPHAHLVEFGHALVKARHEGETGLRGRRGQKKLVPVKTKRVIGHVPAYPVLRPAFDMRKREALAIFKREIWAALTRVARRVARQAEAGRLSRTARRSLGSAA